MCVGVHCDEGGAEAAASRLSPEPAMSQVAAQHSSQGPAASMAGSAVHAAEPRDVEGSSSGALPQGFFEVQMQDASDFWSRVTVLVLILHQRM